MPSPSLPSAARTMAGRSRDDGPTGATGSAGAVATAGWTSRADVRKTSAATGELVCAPAGTVTARTAITAKDSAISARARGRSIGGRVTKQPSMVNRGSPGVLAPAGALPHDRADLPLAGTRRPQ